MPAVPMQPLIARVKAKTLSVLSALLMRRGTAENS
jgi:hypothetical protein